MSITVKDLIEKYQNVVTESEDGSNTKTDNVKASLLGKTAVLEEEEKKVFLALQTGVVINSVLNERRTARK
jgi:hypothetical protein